MLRVRDRAIQCRHDANGNSTAGPAPSLSLRGGECRGADRARVRIS